MDARRRQTYTGIYEFKNGELQTIQQQCAVGISDIVAQINEIGKPVTFLGDGVAVFRDYIEENCQVQHDYAPAHMNKQRAGAVAWLGLSMQKKADLRQRQNTVRTICVCPRQSGNVRKC